MTFNFDIESQLQRLATKQKPYLVFTRKYGWIVCQPSRVADEAGLAGYSRPGSVRIVLHQVLAIADLPPPPESAL